MAFCKARQKISPEAFKELLEIYVSEPYSNGSTQVQSLVSCLYDVLNHTILDASMNPYDFNERKVVIEHINKLDNLRTKKAYHHVVCHILRKQVIQSKHTCLNICLVRFLFLQTLFFVWLIILRQNHFFVL